MTAELWKLDTPAADALKLIVLTGCRKSEAMQARWSDITLGEANWHRKAVDLKGKRDHDLWLNSVAVQLLTQIRDETLARDGRLGEFVFPGHGKTRHITSLRKTWLAILKAAGIDDLHVHDMRHHFASVLVSAGVSEAVIGRLLAHRSPTSTRRYARPFRAPQIEASERAAEIITSNVLAFTGKRRA